MTGLPTMAAPERSPAASISARLSAHIVKTAWSEIPDATVRITTRSHGLLERHVKHIPGSPESPLTDADLQTKFRECSATGDAPLGQARGELLLERFSGIENHADMADCFDGIL